MPSILTAWELSPLFSKLLLVMQMSQRAEAAQKTDGEGAPSPTASTLWRFLFRKVTRCQTIGMRSGTI